MSLYCFSVLTSLVSQFPDVIDLFLELGFIQNATRILLESQGEKVHGWLMCPKYIVLPKQVLCYWCCAYIHNDIKKLKLYIYTARNLENKLKIIICVPYSQAEWHVDSFFYML